MNKYTSELQEISLALIALSERLDRIVGLNATELRVPGDIAEMVAAKVDKRQCLICSKTISAKEKYTRGLCQKDYNLTSARIRSGKWIEAERMRIGKLAPSHLTGREAAADRFETPTDAKKASDEKLIDKAKRKARKKPD